MPDFSDPEVWMTNIAAMKECGLLAKTGRDDGQPEPSAALIANFVRELDDDSTFEVMNRLLKGQRVAPVFRIRMLTAMFHAINMVGGFYSKGQKETVSAYMFILSTLCPLDQILFTKKWDVPL